MRPVDDELARQLISNCLQDPLDTGKRSILADYLAERGLLTDAAVDILREESGQWVNGALDDKLLPDLGFQFDVFKYLQRIIGDSYGIRSAIGSDICISMGRCDLLRCATDRCGLLSWVHLSEGKFLCGQCRSDRWNSAAGYSRYTPGTQFATSLPEGSRFTHAGSRFTHASVATAPSSGFYLAGYSPDSPPEIRRTVESREYIPAGAIISVGEDGRAVRWREGLSVVGVAIDSSREVRPNDYRTTIRVSPPG